MSVPDFHPEDCGYIHCDPSTWEKRKLEEELGEDCPTHESPARLKMRLAWVRDAEESMR